MKKFLTSAETRELIDKKYSLINQVENLSYRISSEHLSFGEILKIENQIEKLEAEIYNINKTLSTIPTIIRE